jgi:hypothetical protein
MEDGVYGKGTASNGIRDIIDMLREKEMTMEALAK